MRKAVEHTVHKMNCLTLKLFETFILYYIGFFYAVNAHKLHIIISQLFRIMSYICSWFSVLLL